MAFFFFRLCLNHEMESFSDDPTLLPFCLNTAIKKAQYFNIQSDEVYDAWKSHLSKVIKESSPTDISSTCHIFPRLYKVDTLSLHRVINRLQYFRLITNLTSLNNFY